ncbi:MAG: hypothetical protein KatS3mg087_1639 [Patescibacteria group bacterium]|nr:MAG: hypothetical protein KatS3mg087_1639 [Patescibacteria group bacterium]
MDKELFFKIKDRLKEIDYSPLPKNLQDSLRLYLEKGIPPGDFLRAVLENDLINTVRFADRINRDKIYYLVRFIRFYVPVACWGSKENVQEWIELHKQYKENEEVEK